MFKQFLTIFIVLTIAQFTQAQIFYTPVQYQYGQSTKFYYGGSNPTVIAFGCAQLPNPTYAAPPIIYSDARPCENVAIDGYSISDARNQAYANVPTYFRKRDLIAAATRSPDGSLIIPAQTQPQEHHSARAPSQIQQSYPRPILIIPRGQLLPPPPKSNNITITMN